jgi:UDP-N-acetylmuramoyl-tripeptide--D-alanyl-D-alanine ligase
MIRGALLIRPDIALILSVAAIHTDNFKTLEDTAREKSRLLTFLGRHGIAVLNGSDPRVAAMARGLRCRVVWFGASPEFELWSSEASAQWPSRLAFRISTRDSSYQVKTQFVGLHWAGAVTGALAVAKACGVPLEQAVACIENVAPFPGRSQAAPLDNGAVILRDDYNGSYTTALASFEVMRNAKAKRRIAILSDCNDLKQSRPERVRHLADLACEFSDMLVFIGEDASHGVERALERGLAPENIHAFAKWEDAAAFLSENLGPGDLALLRSRRDGHLSRIYYALQGEVKCHLADCPLRMACDACPQLGFVPRSALSAPQRLAARVN